jgi:hypothetical protein
VLRHSLTSTELEHKEEKKIELLPCELKKKAQAAIKFGFFKQFFEKTNNNKIEYLVAL